MFQNHKPLALGCMGMSGTWNAGDLTPERTKKPPGTGHGRKQGSATYFSFASRAFAWSWSRFCQKSVAGMATAA